MLDVIGIGVGPFNLSLAALLGSRTSLQAAFLEQRPSFNWHAGMMLPHTTLQVPFLADLVSLIDPTSRYGFLNYLHQQRRLLNFYFLEDFKILRAEYNHYCQWVAAQLDSVQFDSKVLDVSADPQGFVVTSEQAGKQITQHSKNVVIGTGTVPTLPKSLQTVSATYPNRCMHSAHFATRFDAETQAALSAIRATGRMPKVLVLGAGQSAAEVFRALFDDQLGAGGDVRQPKYELEWMTRSSGFFPMEYSPLGLEHFSPQYADYFYALDGTVKSDLLRQQDLLYKGMGFSTIQDIYQRLYARTVAGGAAYATLASSCELQSVSADNGVFAVTWYQTEQGQTFTKTYDVIIAATGYRQNTPECLQEIMSATAHDALGQPCIQRDYQLQYDWPYADKHPQDEPRGQSATNIAAGRVFIQNQELHSHGVGAPDLGLGAYRAGCIVNALAGESVFDTEALQVFQHFEAPIATA